MRHSVDKYDPAFLSVRHKQERLSDISALASNKPSLVIGRNVELETEIQADRKDQDCPDDSDHRYSAHS